MVLIAICIVFAIFILICCCCCCCSHGYFRREYGSSEGQSGSNAVHIYPFIMDGKIPTNQKIDVI
jgi:hypothetical protein